MHILVFLVAGVASWFYPTHQYDGMRVCAYPDRHLIGAVIGIENDANQHSSSCVVIGTGPFAAGRVLDVSPLVRDDLGFTGVTHVHVYRIVGSARCRRQPGPSSCTERPPLPCVIRSFSPSRLVCK